MAEQYEIVIRNETSGQKTPVATQPYTNGGGSVATPITKKTTDANGNNQNGFASAIVAANVIKPYVQQAMSFGISQVEMRTGSPELQRKLSAYSQIGSSATSIIAAGAMGGGVGVLAATAALALSTGIETAINAVNIQNKKTIEAENLQLAKSRAGMVSNHSRGGVV